MTVANPVPATDADLELELVHDAAYIAAVKATGRSAELRRDAGDRPEAPQLRAAVMFGLGTEDNPVFAAPGI